MHRFLTALFVMSVLLAACAPVTNQPTGVPAPAAPPDSGDDNASATLPETPHPTGIPNSAVKIEPAVIQTPEGTELWATPVDQTQILNNLASQGWALCPEEQIELYEEGIVIACPGSQPEGMTQALTLAPAIALSDGPEPFIADAVAVMFILYTGVVVLSELELPRVVLLKDPRTLPDVVVPPGVVPPPEHISNHPRGEYLAKLKSLGWIAVWQAWQNAQTGGQKPDWCGRRPSDGALLVVYYGLQIVSSTGRIYQGFGIVVNMGGAHLSTVLTKVSAPPPGQMPTSGNSSGNDFEQFEVIPPDLCPPPPLSVAQ